MTTNMDVGTFMRIVSEILSNLKYARVKNNNDTIVHKILTKLPKKFDIFV